MNNISIIPINTIKPLTPTPIPQEARDSDLATNINLNIGGNISITETEERHEYQKTHDTWGGDLGMAALGGAMTGLAGGLGMGAENFIGGSLTGLAMSGASAFGSSNVGAVISENRKGTSNGTYTTNQIGSDIVALNNINITTNNNLNIAGSDLTSGNDTALTSNNGTVNILAAIETQTTEESKTKTNWKGVDFTHTNSSVGVGASVERNITSNTTTTQYAKSSNIQSGNNITINSGNNNISSTPLSTSSTSPLTNEGKESNNTNKQNINIIGSNIIAENDIKSNADNGDINVVSQELLQDVLDRQKTETIMASVGISNTFAKTAMDIADGINQHNGYDNNAEGYASLATNLVFDGLNNLLTLGTLGFGASATVSYTNTETNTSQNNTYNQSSNIISNKGNIDLTAENDINIKGSTIATNNADHQENKGNINITSNNGDINITASKDTTNVGSDTHSNSVDIDLSLIPTYSYNDSETTIEQTKYNNSIISANGNNSKINIESKNKDINIKGANIEADDDINLLAQNGNMNIESNQDRYYSNTDNWGMQLGGSVGFNVGKDYKEDITNNYTTIISHKKDEDGNNINGVNIDTNNLTLVGIQDKTKNNLLDKDTSIVRETITETQLQEKHDSEYYDFGITYSLPVSIGDLNQKVNNALSSAFEKVSNTLKQTNTTTRLLLGAGITKLNTPPTAKDPLQPKTDSQSIINSGNWADSWKNTTISYKDDNGWDFVASPASAYQSVVITGTALKYGMVGTEEIAEFGRETLEKIPGTGLIVSQPFSVVEGFFDYFVENDSYILIDGKKIYNPTEEQIRQAKNYYVNGINNDEKYIEAHSKDHPDQVVRYNPTSGVSGDLVESTLGKLFNWNGLTAQLGSMNRVVANDLTIRKDFRITENKFHSQGTIIGTGALNILNWNNVELDRTQIIRAVGPAVYETEWNKSASKVTIPTTFVISKDSPLGKSGDVLYKNIKYDHDDQDGVRDVTSPRTHVHLFKGIYNLITNMDKHNVSNPKYN